MNQILKRQTSRSHYGSKAPAVTITVFKYRNKIGKIVVKTVPPHWLYEKHGGCPKRGRNYLPSSGALVHTRCIVGSVLLIFLVICVCFFILFVFVLCLVCYNVYIKYIKRPLYISPFLALFISKTFADAGFDHLNVAPSSWWNELKWCNCVIGVWRLTRSLLPLFIAVAC